MLELAELDSMYRSKARPVLTPKELRRGAGRGLLTRPVLGVGALAERARIVCAWTCEASPSRSSSSSPSSSLSARAVARSRRSAAARAALARPKSAAHSAAKPPAR